MSPGRSKSPRNIVSDLLFTGRSHLAETRLGQSLELEAPERIPTRSDLNADPDCEYDSPAWWEGVYTGEIDYEATPAWAMRTDGISEAGLLQATSAIGTTITATLAPSSKRTKVKGRYGVHESIARGYYLTDPDNLVWDLVIDTPPLDGRVEHIKTRVTGGYLVLQETLKAYEYWVIASKRALAHWSLSENNKLKGQYTDRHTDPQDHGPWYPDFIVPFKNGDHPLSQSVVGSLYDGARVGRIGGEARGHLPRWFSETPQGVPFIKSLPEYPLGDWRLDLAQRNPKLPILGNMLLAMGIQELLIECEYTKRAEAFMAKGNGEKDHWLFENKSQEKMTKLRNTLRQDRHYIIEESSKRIILRIQHSEISFVRAIASDLNIRAKLIDDDKVPSFYETLCGRFMVNLPEHELNCQACRDKKDLLTREAEEAHRRSEGDSMKNTEVRPSTDPRSGPVKTIKAPVVEAAILPAGSLNLENIQEAIENFTALANEHYTKAAYYDDLVKQYQAILDPSDQVREAQQKLREAEEAEEARKAQALRTITEMLTQPQSTGV